MFVDQADPVSAITRRPSGHPLLDGLLNFLRLVKYVIGYHSIGTSVDVLPDGVSYCGYVAQVME